MQNVTIPSPNKELVALVKWLSDNVSKEQTRPSLTYIKFIGRYCWATNGYAIVRAQVLADDLVDFIEPGCYEVLSCTSKILVMIAQPETIFPKVEELYLRCKADLKDSKLTCLDPKLLIPIIKPFGVAYMHTNKGMQISIVLKDYTKLPWGNYTAILMSKNSNVASTEFNEYFPAPEPVVVPPAPVEQTVDTKE